ncbi:MAG: SGNH/GDSL hydrolase family protein, partial [Marinibacterium sp.]|nr:SGNH/GDSL hydrolase family protein [Marinibacterium sp.]
QGSLTAALSADGSVTLDLSALADGPITTSVTATDTTGNTANVNGPGLTLITGAITDFGFSTEALAIDLRNNSYQAAARVVVIGDSLSVGLVDVTVPFDPETAEGWREDLFENLLSEGAWIDYVGNEADGPDRMLDRDHSAQSGVSLRKILDGRSVIANIPSNVATHDPDIMLLMAGTNDYKEINFFNRFPGILAHTTLAIEEFYSAAGTLDKHVVISTNPPKTSDAPAIYSQYLNEGYSMVDGQPVVGDAGNGTYKPGLKQTVLDLQTTYPNLHLFENPLTVDDLSPDNVHFTQAGYAKYADALTDLLVNEIGITAGTLGDETGADFTPGAQIRGSGFGDRIIGDDAANVIYGGDGNDVIEGNAGNDVLAGEAGIDRINGGAGVDHLTGGADADAFVFDTDFASGHGAGDADTVADFDATEDWLIFDGAMRDQITVSDEAGGAVRLSVSGYGDIVVQGSGAGALKGADRGDGTFDLTTDEQLISYYDNLGVGLV